MVMILWQRNLSIYYHDAHLMLISIAALRNSTVFTALRYKLLIDDIAELFITSI